MSDITDQKSDVTDTAAPADKPETAGTSRRRRTGTGLQAMLLPELQTMASSLGISGTARMRKGELIAAIQTNQGVPVTAAAGTTSEAPATTRRSAPEKPAAAAAEQPSLPGTEQGDDSRSEPRARRATRPAGPPQPRVGRAAAEAPADEPARAAEAPARVNAEPVAAERTNERTNAEPAARSTRADEARNERRPARGERTQDQQGRNERPERGERSEEQGGRDRGERRERGAGRADEADRGQRNNQRSERPARDADQAANRGQARNEDRGPDRDDDGDDDGDRRGRRSRFRDRRGRRNDRGEAGGNEREPQQQFNDDDVLVPVAGIVDVLDSYAFIRTTGYLSGPNDVYVSMSQVRKYGLRRGDAVTGAVRQAKDGEQRRDKYNPLARLDTVNGMEPDAARNRPEFYKLTPLYPQERLRLETDQNVLTTRVIDLVMPIGKGQRALIVSPPKAGKTMVMQAISNAITANNPECHLMVVLVDERPEEVTDMQRSVKGEVIASTFDRPPSDHTTVAELAIERAKRLVELGHDVVVLLDSITRLGRAYNNASPASGRILSGGIDSTALYPPKRFLGAARNIENGGSLTIIATAMVETGSTGDTVIFEEFKGTGNAELKLDRKLAEKRIFPAVDVITSGTRREEILMAGEEMAIVHKLRKVLHGLDPQQALELLLDRLKKTSTNVEFLMQIAKSTPGE
ncbi:transcription termination factor Rho [Longispora fulva]|uniref:Transcription termination factor Rho n=1 Tax=Longispora fulva TaxID=619741 RepID=A0A8J7GP60_9ACTN|nr:transcription termination factor Rho [Longispora fulva]MBG6140812.1 transcription termination factor Rho [Longispora fulva]GIG60924.1 transcription termination factor Rho [Longispora fulva]